MRNCQTNQCVEVRWNKSEILLGLCRRTKTNVVDLDMKHKQKLVLHTEASVQWKGGRHIYVSRYSSSGSV